MSEPSGVTENGDSSELQDSIASLRGVSKIYGNENLQVKALDQVDLDIARGKFSAIMGPSGSGKSTLLHVLAGLDTPTSGSIIVAGHDLTKMNDNQITHFRRDNIGFVFQAFNLIPTIDARANIELPLRLAGRKPDAQWFDQVIIALGLNDRLHHKPYELSGGQIQRVAVARALLSKPALIVADEPTGNLDSASSKEVLHLLRSAVDSLGQTVLMVTHDRHAAAVADRVLVVRDGRVVTTLNKPTVAQIEQVA